MVQAGCETRRLGPDALESIFTGHVTPEVAESGRKAAYDLLGDRSIRYWTIDVSAISGFDPAVRSVGFAWMKAFRARGGVRMFIVTEQSFVRMMGSALAFATGMPVSFVRTRDEANERMTP